MVDEGKPRSDEARSEFTPPLGVPAPPESSSDDAPTSEFAAPTGVDVPAEPGPQGSAFAPPGGRQPAAPVPAPHGGYPGYPAYTPPLGIPMVNLSKETPWPDRMRAMLRMSVTERPAPEQAAERAESGPPVPRVLDLTLRIGELLLAGGEGAEDVEAAMLGVAHAYGLARVEPTVTFTLLGISHQPSLIDPPVTANRTVRRRGTDYTRLAAVFRLVDDITTEALTLEDAYRRLAEIRRNRHPYPGRLLTAAAGLLAGAASMLVGGGGPVVFLIAAIGAMLGDRLAWLCAGRGLPEFYQFTAAAMPAAVLGVLVDRFGHHLPGTSTIQASAVITGGLFALIPGRALVAAVQDGLTGFYITASARLLEVMYLFTGIVVGVTLVLYAGVSLGAELDPQQTLRTYENPPVQLVAAMALSLAFAVLLQCERGVLLIATLNGGVAWTVYGVLHQKAAGVGMSPVAATAVAAGLVGLFGQMLSRHRHASALPYVTAAIGPLLPGSATYFGLLGLTQGHLSQGLASLTKAAALALAVAIGVNLGGEIARMFLQVPGAGDPAQRRAAKRTRGF